MEERVAVLLGAGASADAGLPLTTALAEMIVRNVNASARLAGGALPNWVRALNFVYGSMVGYQAEDSSDPLQAVNIERLISALRLLQDSQAHEAAPFVAAWKPGALGVGTPEADAHLGGKALSAVSDSMGQSFGGDQEMADAIAAIAREATRGSNPREFEEAEEHLLSELSAVLNNLKSVEYLYPLADLARSQAGGLDILTLNYDLTIERMAQETSTPIDRGIGSWKPGRLLERSRADGLINLHKLHGSLDWELALDRRVTQPPEILAPESQRSGGEPVGNAAPFRPRTRPWIVVGDREKLATDGPTLELLHSATSALRSSTHLVVVGYSFSDAHINAMIRDWLAADESRTIGILDMNWRAPDHVPFRRALITRYGADDERGARSRIAPIPGSASEALAAALQARPERPNPDPYMSASHQIGHDHIVAQVTLLGPDLYRASVAFHYATESNSHRRGTYSRGQDTYETLDELNAGRRPQPMSSWAPVHVEHWRTGDAISLFSQAPPPGPVEIQVYGYRMDAHGPVTSVLEIVSPATAELPTETTI